jgi:hypothetical protein
MSYSVAPDLELHKFTPVRKAQGLYQALVRQAVLQEANMEGSLSNRGTGLEVKAGEKALCVLRAKGHPETKLLEQREWTGKSHFDTTVIRQLEVVATASDCVLVVEVACQVQSVNAAYLLSALDFLGVLSAEDHLVLCCRNTPFVTCLKQM